MGDVLDDLVVAAGWQHEVSVGALCAQWPQIVGVDVAEHATVVDFTDGTLTVQADSTAWATQLTLLQGSLLAAISRSLGDGIVLRLTVRGPSVRTFSRGPRAVRGRGVRDTYG